MQNNLTLGEKIKKFRIKAGLSQLQLETAIGASPGVISRIESEKTNPNKETLSKISKALQLSSYENAALLGLNIYNLEQLISAINTLSKCLDLDTTLQTAVDIMFNLFPNYNGGVIALKKGDYVYARTVSNMPKMDYVINKILPCNLEDIISKISSNENLVAESINKNEIYQSFSLHDFVRGPLNEFVSLAIMITVGLKSGIVIPLVFENKILGTVFYAKRIKEKFSDEEIRILSLLNEQLAIAINKAMVFEKLNKKNAK